jgi:hypothetical protein
MLPSISRFDECLCENLPSAIRAFRWRLHDVIRHRGIAAGNEVENPIEGNLGSGRIAVLAGLNKLPPSRTVQVAITTTFCWSKHREGLRK